MKKLLYQGSVKNLYQIDENVEFEFTDQYSIYDWGVMPDLISEKGSYLAQMGSFLFEKLQSPETFSKPELPSHFSKEEQASLLNSKVLTELQTNGAKTHFIKYQAPASMVVKKVNILAPTVTANGYDYSQYTEKPTNSLIPLEVVWRLGAPEGSSLLKRDPSIFPNQKFSSIRVEFYTKLEPQDRLLTQDEALQMSGLTDLELTNLVDQTKIFAATLNNIFSQAGLELWDGKFEFAFGEAKGDAREIILVDSIGPDELRLTHKGFSFSKEYLRSCYQNSEWLQELNRNKEIHGDNFKQATKSSPAPLLSEQKAIASEIYTSIYNSLQNQCLTLGHNMENHLDSLGKNIALFGKGGREHALAKHLASSKDIKNVFVIPGNPGMKQEKVQTVDLAEEQYIDFCKSNQISYALIGPEDLLANALVDNLEDAGIPCVSPNKKAATLESSKAFSKDFMQKHQIPTASYKSFTNSQEAQNYVADQSEMPFVVKLSGLAAGKGVIICKNKAEATSAIEELAPNDEEIVIEEFLEGKEVSFFALCMGEAYKVLGTACDYKRLKDNNIGPNTGGMGCYSPANWLTPEELTNIEKNILVPTLKGLELESIFFKGTLFIGIMMTAQGPKVLEYNVRFGDPETQTILPRLNSNLHPVFEAMALNSKEDFHNTTITYSEQASIHIVKAAKGYPGTGGMVVEKGKVIESNVTNGPNTQLFYAGIKAQGNKFVTNGGRVLGLTNLGKDINEARELAYKNIELIHFEGEQFRKDIGL